MRYFLTILIIAIFQFSAQAQDSTLIRLQQKMDRQEKLQKDLVYSFNSVSYVHQLDKQGMIEKTDTIKTWQKFKGDSLQEYTLLFSSEKKQKEKDGDKKEHRESSQLPKLDDPAYDFKVDRDRGLISFAPRKPKKGDLAGEISYDAQGLYLKGLQATMPKLKWPVNEFRMNITFSQVEGFLFPSEFRMQAGWNALISKGRIRVESSNSDYKIYR
jgi:hypothetical protein